VVTNYYDKLFFIDRYVVTRLQSGNWDQQPNDESIYEIGNPNIVETIIDPNIPVNVTLDVNDWGSVDLLAQIVGQGKYNNSNKNQASITQANFKKQKSDILVRVRHNELETLHHSVWIPNCTLDSFSWSYSVDGNATENYTFTGDTDRFYFTDWRDAAIDIGTYASSTTFTTNVDPGSSTFTGLYASINGKIYPFKNGSTDLMTWASNTGSGTVTVTANGTNYGIPSLATGDRIRVLYYRTTPNSTFTQLDTDGIAAVKGGFVEIRMFNDSGSAPSQYTTNLQSVTINGAFTRDDIKELGNYQLVDRPLRNLQLNIDVTMLEDDLALWLNAMGGDSSTTEAKLQDTIDEEQTIEVKIYDNYDKTNLLKTITISNAKVLSSPFNTDVNSNGTITFSLRADEFTVAGSGTSGNRLANAYPTGYPYMGTDS